MQHSELALSDPLLPREHLCRSAPLASHVHWLLPLFLFVHLSHVRTPTAMGVRAVQE